MIALPLQKHARGDGNSVFLDDQAVPHRDQWAFLSTVQRIERAHLEAIAATLIDVGASWACAFRRRKMTIQHRGRRRRRVAEWTHRLSVTFRGHSN